MVAYPYVATLVNPGFENGAVMAGWAVISPDTGAKPVSSALVGLNNTAPHSGSWASIMSAGASKGWYGQTYTIDASLLSDVDAGHLQLTVATWLLGNSGETPPRDPGALVVELYDGSSVWLAGYHEALTQAASVTVWGQRSITIEVPPGARSVRLGCRGLRLAGAELSIYTDDWTLTFAYTTKKPVKSPILLSMLAADATGWTNVSGGSLSTILQTNAWLWDTIFYFNSGPTCEAYKDFTITDAGQIAAIDASDAKLLLYARQATFSTADQGRMWVEFYTSGGVLLGSRVGTDTTDVTVDEYGQPKSIYTDIPATCRKVRLGIHGTRLNGTNTDCYFSSIFMGIGYGGIPASASYSPGTITLSGPAFTGQVAASCNYTLPTITLSAPIFSAIATATGTYSPGTITLSGPSFTGLAQVGNYALPTITMTAGTWRSLGLARAAELDVAAVVYTPSSARAAELDVAVLVIPETDTAARAAELDVAVLAYGGPCATRRCQVWKITRQDGEVFAFTSLDEDIVWRGLTYRACKSLSASASESSSELQGVGNIELTGILDDDAISAADLYAGLWNDAYVEVWVIPWDGQPDDQAPFRLSAGWTGRVTRGEHNFNAEVLGPHSRLQQAALTETITPGCRFDFGDVRCGVDVEAKALLGIAVTGQQSRSLVFFAHGDPGGTDIWDGGKVRWASGRNAGVTCQVDRVDFGATALTLWDLAPYPPEAGDTFDLLPGCPYTTDGCTTYANRSRYGGFDDVPGPDALQSNADSLFTG